MEKGEEDEKVRRRSRGKERGKGVGEREEDRIDRQMGGRTRYGK